MIVKTSYPDIATIKNLISKLIVENAGASSDARERELNAEEKVRLDYAGRVLFELFQNAVDRAESTIRIRGVPPVDGLPGRVFFGNDGAPVSAFDRQPGEKRSDLHALCSLGTSNKTAAESIGNKGIGFRSVFAATNKVRIWSKGRDAAGEVRWWGIELHRPFHPLAPVP